MSTALKDGNRLRAGLLARGVRRAATGVKAKEGVEEDREVFGDVCGERGLYYYLEAEMGTH